MSKAAERAGKANVAELVRQGRLKYNSTRGLDPCPNPAVGNTPNPNTGMRAGLSPEKYHAMVLQSERRRRMNKEWDFVPELSEQEMDIYVSWLKSGGPKKIRAAGREAARSQQQDVASLLKQYDPENAARLEAMPALHGTEKLDPIGSTAVDTEDASEEVSLVEDGPQEPEETAAVELPSSPQEAPGYESINADDEDEPTRVVSPGKRGPKAKVK